VGATLNKTPGEARQGREAWACPGEAAERSLDVLVGTSKHGLVLQALACGVTKGTLLIVYIGGRT